MTAHEIEPPEPLEVIGRALAAKAAGEPIDEEAVSEAARVVAAAELVRRGLDVDRAAELLSRPCVIHLEVAAGEFTLSIDFGEGTPWKITGDAS